MVLFCVIDMGLWHISQPGKMTSLAKFIADYVSIQKKNPSKKIQIRY